MSGGSKGRRALGLVAGAASLLLILFCILSAVLVVQNHAGARGEMEARAAAIGNTVASVLEASGADTIESSEVRNSLVRDMAALDDLLWVEVFDATGAVIAHTRPDRVGKPPLPVHERFVSRIISGEGPITEWDEPSDHLNYFVGVRASASRDHHFVVELVFDTRPLTAAIWSDVKEFALLFISATLVHLAAIYFMARRLTRTETTLRTVEGDAATLGKIVEDSLHEVYTFDAETLRFGYVNASARRNLGFSSDELRELTPLDLKELDHEQFEDLIRPLRRGTTDCVQFKSTHLRKDGSRYPVHVNLGIAHREDRSVALALVIDQTEAQRTEEELRVSQNMKIVGQFSAGIAHDFNNLLTAIQGSVEMMRFSEEGEAAEADLTQIEYAVDHAAALTRKLLAFGRRQVNDPVPLDLRSEVEALLPMLRRVISSNIEIDTVFCDMRPVVEIDPGNLEQIITNLVINARDAMRAGGRITVEIGTEMSARGHLARLLVVDTGEGIAPDVQSHLFEPFFTTKESERGTGLGLYTVKGIVEGAGGAIAIRSEVGSGTTVDVRLPVVESTVAPRRGARPVGQEPGGSETIVVCEDELAVLETTRRILERNGYQVLAATDVSTALNHIRSHDTVDLLLTDLMMPSGSGYDLASRAREIAPTLGVLFMSGYDPTTEFRDDAWSHASVVAKPFTAATLVARVRSLLDMRAPLPRQKTQHAASRS